MKKDYRAYRLIFQEVFLMSQIKNPYLVELIGVNLSEKGFSMVMEYMELGDLYSHLKSRDLLPDEKFSEKLKLAIALDIAKGMESLHLHRIIHRDLRSPNVLITSLSIEDNIRAKVCDFGLAQFDSGKEGSRQLSWRWLAPEIISRNKGGASQDYYSFGMLLIEIATRDIPFGRKCGSIDMKLKILKGYRPTLPETCENSYINLTNRCLDGNPEDRPNFTEICKELSIMSGIKPTPRISKNLIEIKTNKTNLSETSAFKFSLKHQQVKFLLRTEFTVQLKAQANNIVVDQDKDQMWVGASDGNIYVYEEKKLLSTINVFKKSITFLLLTPGLIWVFGESGKVTTYNRVTLKISQKPKKLTSGKFTVVKSISLEDKQIIVICDDNGHILFLNEDMSEIGKKTSKTEKYVCSYYDKETSLIFFGSTKPSILSYHIVISKKKEKWK
eukprot:TRINITY_DN7364_c0_g1_i1.p1 TRINITY_DN7364_c0_g1~~TRINITY_DN7364_c0_g1_i1.p1  ORF type:complete len:494 (-),score=123.17 TRINITY_DN7364_c0_g1_i1:787-2115(-)